jgi:hypothetical protein
MTCGGADPVGGDVRGMQKGRGFAAEAADERDISLRAATCVENPLPSLCRSQKSGADSEESTT